jgi:hypothetical protein
MGLSGCLTCYEWLNSRDQSLRVDPHAWVDRIALSCKCLRPGLGTPHSKGIAKAETMSKSTWGGSETSRSSDSIAKSFAECTYPSNIAHGYLNEELSFHRTPASWCLTGAVWPRADCPWAGCLGLGKSNGNFQVHIGTGCLFVWSLSVFFFPTLVNCHLYVLLQG